MEPEAGKRSPEESSLRGYVALTGEEGPDHVAYSIDADFSTSQEAPGPPGRADNRLFELGLGNAKDKYNRLPSHFNDLNNQNIDFSGHVAKVVLR